MRSLKICEPAYPLNKAVCITFISYFFRSSFCIFLYYSDVATCPKFQYLARSRSRWNLRPDLVQEHCYFHGKINMTKCFHRDVKSHNGARGNILAGPSGE